MKLRLFKLKGKNDQSGFTLIELLVVMGLTSVMIVAITDIAVATLSLQRESTAHSSLSEDGRFLLARFTYDIHRASSITAPATLGANSSALTLVIGGINYTYSLSGNNLILTDNTGSNSLNGADTTVSSLNFQRLGNSGGKDTVRISFTITSTTKTDQGDQSSNFITTVERR